MTKEKFKNLLMEHNLTVNDFLDLKDFWYMLSHKDQYELLLGDEKVIEVNGEANRRNQLMGNIVERIKSGWEKRGEN